MAKILPLTRRTNQSFSDNNRVVQGFFFLSFETKNEILDDFLSVRKCFRTYDSGQFQF